MKIKSILFLVIFSAIALAQNDDPREIREIQFKVSKYKGSIDNTPITMLLTYYPDSSISGYYYYERVGQLLMVHKLRGNKSIKLEAEQIELFEIEGEKRETEIFEFPKGIYDNDSAVTGKWIYKGKEKTFSLVKENMRLDWRLFRYKTIGYFKDYPFTKQTQNISIIYPSIKSSPKLNSYFLREDNLISSNIIDYVNSTDGKYLFVKQNFGENTDKLDYCCWTNDESNELVYISNSILTYCYDEMSYGYNAQYYTRYISINITSGEEYTFNNIFKKEYAATVLKMLGDKYKNILSEEGNNSEKNYGAPLATSFNEESDIYISKGGVYFRERASKLDNYYDLFLSFKEVSDYLDPNLKLTMGLQ